MNTLPNRKIEEILERKGVRRDDADGTPRAKSKIDDIIKALRAERIKVVGKEPDA